MATSTSSVTPAPVFDWVNQNTTAKAKKTDIEEAQDRFLTMLTTQLKSQDPMNPMDNAAVTSQMAQISTVTGITQLNSTMKALSASYTSSQSMQATSMINHSVLAAGNTMDLASGQSFGALTVPAGLDSIKVNIYDRNKNLVDTLELSAPKEGQQTFSWDGTSSAGKALTDGQYTFQAFGLKAGKDPISVSTQAYTKVNSVSFTSTGSLLNLANGTQIAPADVKEII